MRINIAENKMKLSLLSVLYFMVALIAPTVSADGITDAATETEQVSALGARHDPSALLMAHDTATASMVISDGPFADVTKNLTTSSRGVRLEPDATTDVWTLGKFAYVGTFQNPCGDGTGVNGSGVRIFDVSNPNKVIEAGFIPSVADSRSNDVKVASMNSGRLLVHSNESCSGGPGGFEIWSVDDPTKPVHGAHVQTDDVNAFAREVFGFVDFGVHNLFLFTQGERDYVAAVVESLLGNFQIFDITDPTSPSQVGFWGAEELRMAELGFDPALVPDLDIDDFDLLLDLEAYLRDGFGASQNRFLHDITVSSDGTDAYLSNWDAGLVLLDISNPSNPKLVSVARDLEADGDMEVNSHSAWPSEDGSVVVEGNEDFAPSAPLSFEITEGPNAGEFPATEGAFTVPIASLTGEGMSGPTKYVGLACGSVPAPGGAGEIAVIQRGVCEFDEKAQNAIDAGYSGMIVFNDAASGDALVVMDGDPRDMPGVFVGHSTGLAIFDVVSEAGLILGNNGAAVAATGEADGWGGVRIWDYSDPTNPVLASTFDTVCSALVIHPSCDPRGTYTVHNVIVESGKAYISWYTDGVLVLDISDPFYPVEIARYHREGPEFEAANGGIQDVWGIYKEPKMPWVYASDRNGGLYVLKEYGSGSANQGQR